MIEPLLSTIRLPEVLDALTQGKIKLCTSHVSDMYKLFADTKHFNLPIGSWGVSNVTDMDSMFAGAVEFNQPIGGWDVSKVLNMRSIFRGATSFSQDLDAWQLL